MSFEYMAWASKQKTGHASTKIVLLALANFADVDGVTYPSAGYIARMTEQSEKTIYRAIEKLVDMGFIERRRKRRKDGSLGTYEYQLLTTGQNVHKGEALPDKMSTTPPDKMSTQILSDLNQSDKKDIPNGISKNTDCEFEDLFWPITAKKVGKDAARKQFLKARGRAALEDILPAWRAMNSLWLKEKGTDRWQFIPHPSTWLSEGRWQDEIIETPRGNQNGKYTASDALREVIGEIRADSLHGGAMLCDTRHIREDRYAIENFNENYD